MPIYRLLQNSAFTPEHIQAMGTAFERALVELGLVNRDDPLAEIVAKRIVEAAQRGERDPARLGEMAVADFARNFIPLVANNTKPAAAFPNDTASAVNGTSVAELLGVLVHTAIEQTEGKARAAFYIADADGRELRHLVGMTRAYARYVDGFAISPDSLACGLAASTRRPIITPDVVEEPRWKPWLWLAKEFDYRACWSFPVETFTGKVVGTFAMYYRDPTEATPRDVDFAALLTRTAAPIILRQAQ